ncbi:MAG: hypothetical protein E6K83_03445 [Thaumarchaeota archaeon]|nr:MAG: hypothetical protein AUI92_03875 [Thaumarchaeota archaeon 13_1_40CM_3_38_6]OLD29843.1 MAG: hypothetical protein AUI62_02155 [Thaumarchaeota archaeon 13_1_40CM_2_39_7]OLE40582.1 MAG: hypothetical protein AUF74_00315 [Thaumarchaeota archaeon 13_1_20CM_2_38_5]TLY08215.1 MAG: hypothetical protein E6K83_03445 [Nitrososphaerota archaeon]
MIFSKKKEIINPYTVEECNSCHAISKRKFREGDYVFKAADRCDSCKIGYMMIAKVFGEVVK